MKKYALILTVLISFVFKVNSQNYNFPAFNNNIALNDSLNNYSFVLVGTCGNVADFHTLILTNNSGLAPIASSVNLQFVITKIVSFPSSSVYCTQTGTVPVIVGNVFKFTNANQLFAFTCTPGATVTGKFMVNGTPTIINESYECGFHMSLTLGTCNNSCMLTGLNKFLFSNPLCNVGISNGISTQTKSNVINVFPNPAEEYLKLEGDIKSKYLNYQITNLNGQLIQKAPFKEFPAILDIGHIPPGVYFISISDNNKQFYNTKLVKK